VDLILTPETLGLLGLVAAIAGFADALAGGGGLITIPILLLVQLPPIAAVATNKFQGTFGTLTAAITLTRKGQVNLAAIGACLPWAFFGAVLGALCVQWIDPKSLDALIPLILAGIAIYFLFAPKAGDVAAKPRLPAAITCRLVVPAIGFYDGFFGPGAGSFFALCGVALRGETLVRATGSAKVLNFVTNAASLGVFIASGKVVWLAGAAMIVGQIVGAYMGSLAIVAGGARLIRPFIIFTSLAMIIRYAWQKGWFSL
jgi:uncharacterized protein